MYINEVNIVFQMLNRKKNVCSALNVNSVLYCDHNVE